MCITCVRLAQLASMVVEHGAFPSWEMVFADFNNTYVGMFLAAPCLIYAMHATVHLLSWEKLVIRFRSRDGCVLRCAGASIVVAVVCSAWMSSMTLIALVATRPDAAVMGKVMLLAAENSLLQMVFFGTCACLFLMTTALSGSGTVASMSVFLYAAIDLIVAGTPQVSQWFPALGWAIVQITGPYDLMPLAARAVFPLLLSTLCCSIALLAYRKKDFMDKAGARHDA